MKDANEFLWVTMQEVFASSRLSQSLLPSRVWESRIILQDIEVVDALCLKCQLHVNATDLRLLNSHRVWYIALLA